MKKVISFSLWGNKQDYTFGAIKNAELAKTFYPEYECWFYIHEETVPKEIINALEKLSNTKIILKKGDLNTCKPMMWRFEPIDCEEVEIMLSRDTDTRIYMREIIAVDEWLKSNKTFHIMRDHPHHKFTILGGMFGTKKIPSIKSWINIMSNYIQVGNKSYDQNFLNDHIYPAIKNDCLIHANFNKYEDNCLDFTMNYDDEYKFVGEYVYHDNSRSNSHIQDLKNDVLKSKKILINLITSFYFIDKTDDRSLQRNNEISMCLYNNLKNDSIGKIHLYVDDIKSLNKVFNLSTNYCNKIKIIKVGYQPLYSDMFEYAIDNLNDEICMISNSDIYLYKTDLNLLNKLSNNVYALSRHESDFKCHVYGWGSHDSFIFYPKYINKDLLQNMQHVQNVAGSDDNIINILVDSGLKLYNPCFQIVIIHLHNSELRTYTNQKIAHGKYFIKQENIFIDDKDILEDYTWYKGVDYLGSDIFFKPNQTLNQLKYIADNNKAIVAFNTLGFFKSNVNIEELKTTDWINNKNNHGIYVKKII